jgi:RNA polymerase sigma-70 factor (ECF subfamily)
MGSTAEFEARVLPHLDGAYNFARCLTRNPVDAEEVVQEAVLRARSGRW